MAIDKCNSNTKVLIVPLILTAVLSACSNTRDQVGDQLASEDNSNTTELASTNNIPTASNVGRECEINTATISDAISLIINNCEVINNTVNDTAKSSLIFNKNPQLNIQDSFNNMLPDNMEFTLAKRGVGIEMESQPYYNVKNLGALVLFSDDKSLQFMINVKSEF